MRFEQPFQARQTTTSCGTITVVEPDDGNGGTDDPTNGDDGTDQPQIPDSPGGIVDMIGDTGLIALVVLVVALIALTQI